MNEERVEFRAGRDSYGLARWVPGLIKVLPAHCASDEEAHWLPQSETRPLPNPA